MACQFGPYLEILLQNQGAGLTPELQQALINHVPTCAECATRFYAAHAAPQPPAPPSADRRQTAPFEPRPAPPAPGVGLPGRPSSSPFSGYTPGDGFGRSPTPAFTEASGRSPRPDPHGTGDPHDWRAPTPDGSEAWRAATPGLSPLGGDWRNLTPGLQGEWQQPTPTRQHWQHLTPGLGGLYGGPQAPGPAAPGSPPGGPPPPGPPPGWTEAQLREHALREALARIPQTPPEPPRPPPGPAPTGYDAEVPLFGLSGRRRAIAEGLLITVLVLAGLALFMAWDFETPESEEAVARLRSMPVGPTAGVRVLRERKDGVLEPVRGQMLADDRLRFSYLHTADWQRLLIFVVDDVGNVYWQYPDWSDRRTNPVAPAILSDREEHEVPAAVHREWEGDLLIVYTIFTKDLVYVRDVEARLADKERDLSKPLVPGSLQSVTTLRLVRIDAAGVDPSDQPPGVDPNGPREETADEARDREAQDSVPAEPGGTLSIQPWASSPKESWQE